MKILIIALGCTCIHATAQPVGSNQLQLGQVNAITVKIPNQDANKCNVEISVPGGQSFQKEVSGPSFETGLELTPSQAGPFSVEWKGKYKSRGLNSVGGCSGSGVFQFQVSQNTESIKRKWTELFARSKQDFTDCIKVGLELSKLKIENPSKEEKISDPDDANAKEVISKCDAFIATKTIWQDKNQASFECTLKDQVKTLCEGVYAERTSDNVLKLISKTQAVQYHFENKKWVTAQRENSEGKAQRVQKEEENKVAIEAANLAKKAQEEKEEKLKNSPEYKKQQADLAKQKLAEERVEAERERKEKIALALQEKEKEKRRIADEQEQQVKERAEKIETEKRQALEAKERLEFEKRKQFESALVRPLISSGDPRISCQSKWYLDPRFSQLSTKISLTGVTDLSFPMLSDQSVANPREQQAIAALADEFKKCVNESASFRSSNYPSDLRSILEKEDAAFLEASIELYSKKMTFGKYNLSIQQIAKESKTNLESLQQRRQAQKAAEEDAARTRAATLRDAQNRQEQQRISEQNQRSAEQNRQYQMQQAQQERIAAAKRQWAARCEFDKRNAYEQYMKAHEYDCNNPRNRSLGALCAIGVISAANDYGAASFNSCMSGAPN